VVGDLDDLADRVTQGGYRMVAVVPDPQRTRRWLQRLAWQLAPTAADLVVSPVLMEVTGLGCTSHRCSAGRCCGSPRRGPRASGGKPRARWTWWPVVGLLLRSRSPDGRPMAGTS